MNELYAKKIQRTIHSEVTTHFTLRRNNALYTQKKQRTFRINNALYTQKKQRTLHSEETTHFTLGRKGEHSEK